MTVIEPIYIQYANKIKLLLDSIVAYNDKYIVRKNSDTSYCIYDKTNKFNHGFFRKDLCARMVGEIWFWNSARGADLTHNIISFDYKESSYNDMKMLGEALETAFEKVYGGELKVYLIKGLYDYTFYSLKDDMVKKWPIDY